MKIKYFFLRYMSVILMCALTLISAILALFFSYSSRNEMEYFFPWSFCGDALFPLIIFSFALWFRSRMCAVAAVLLSFFSIFFRAASIIIYRKTLMPMDFFSIQMLWEHADITGIKAVLGKHCFWWLIPLCILALSTIIYLCTIIWRSSGKNRKKLSQVWHITFAVLLVLSALSNISYVVVDKAYDEYFYTGHQVKPLTFGVADIAEDSLLHFFPHKHEKVELSPESKSVLDRHGVLCDGGRECCKKITAQEFKKIIIIAIESLDYDFIGAANSAIPPGITPELDMLHIQFPSMTNYFSATQPTSWGLTAIILSRFDYRYESKYRTGESLFTVAKSRGYATYYFSPVSGTFANNNETYRAAFRPEKIFFKEEWQKHFTRQEFQNNEWGLSDQELYQGVYQVLERDKRERFIAVISTIDTHPPYNAPALSKDEKKNMQSNFLASLHSADRSLGKFIRKVMSNPQLYDENTLIIVTADHSATHGENYLKRKDYNPSRVPLIFITPKTSLFDRLDVNKYASSIDLAPTLIQLIGGEVPDSFMGRSLFSDKNIALCWVINQVMFIHTKDGIQSLDVKNPPENDSGKAFYDFYRMYYRN